MTNISIRKFPIQEIFFIFFIIFTSASWTGKQSKSWAPREKNRIQIQLFSLGSGQGIQIQVLVKMLLVVHTPEICACHTCPNSPRKVMSEEEGPLLFGKPCWNSNNWQCIHRKKHLLKFDHISLSKSNCCLLPYLQRNLCSFHDFVLYSDLIEEWQRCRKPDFISYNIRPLI